MFHQGPIQVEITSKVQKMRLLLSAIIIWLARKTTKGLSTKIANFPNEQVDLEPEFTDALNRLSRVKSTRIAMDLVRKDKAHQEIKKSLKLVAPYKGLKCK